jgi:RNase P protein component
MTVTRNRLKKLKLTELSLVDRPANPHAMIVIAKREVAPVLFEEALSALKNDASCVEDVHALTPLKRVRRKRRTKETP